MINKNGDSHEPPFLFIYVRNLFFQHNLHNLASSLRYRSTRTEDSYYTSLVQVIVVLHWDYTTGKYEVIYTEV